MPRPDPTPGGPVWIDAAARHAPLLILMHQALFVALRVVTPGGYGIDEAEQLLATQSVELGYGAQPPLYTWLQMAVFAVTGPGKLGLALLKHGLLAAFALAVWSSMLALTGDRRLAMVGAFALMLAPPIGWEAHRALSHTVLALTCGAVAFRLALQCRARGRRGDFALLGLAIGAGLLAKTNVVFLVVGLVAALWRDGPAGA
ncbi:MAG: ArnT family glycosyltransferase, partial [Rubrimonas sp.]